MKTKTAKIIFKATAHIQLYVDGVSAFIQIIAVLRILFLLNEFPVLQNLNELCSLHPY